MLLSERSVVRQHQKREMIPMRLYPILAVVLVTVSTACAADIPAFPGAEGFGANTPGGRGGQVIAVTSLNDSGPGSLREACLTPGPRIIVFRVGGVIELESYIRFSEPFCTIAGQTAPGGGICLKNYGLYLRDTHDIIVRHLRVRPGDPAQKELDAITVYLCRRVIIDHCSTSWGIDETFSITDSQDVTMQWCIISEALNDSVHNKGAHGYGSLISYNGEGGITCHHNVWAHNNSRNPRPGGKEGMPGFTLDFRNNLIYNWGGAAGYNGLLPQKINYVANFLRPGPSTRESAARYAFNIGGVATSFFAEGNILDGRPEATADNWQMIRLPKDAAREDVDAGQAYPAPPINQHPAEELLGAIVEGCGATLPARDAVDARVMENICAGTGAIINSQDAVGGWPEYSAGEAAPDTDADGMSDAWETANDLDPQDASDGVGDVDGDGYTNIEEFINATDPNVPDTE